MDAAKSERLHKRIAGSGLCSRRKAEEWIRAGRVEVNGEVVREMGVQVFPSDDVRVDGGPVRPETPTYLVLNKPVGYVTTLDDPHASRTVAQLVPDVGAHLRPVGRLDKDTEGLLVLTNDGLLAARLSHPRYGIEKEYVVQARGLMEDKSLDRLRDGVPIDGRRTSPAKLLKVYRDPGRNSTAFHIVLHEGRNRQVRKMCEAVGHFVLSLKRVRIGPLHLGSLPKGASRLISKQELGALRLATGLQPAEGAPAAKRARNSSPAASRGRAASSARKRPSSR